MVIFGKNVLLWGPCGVRTASHQIAEHHERKPVDECASRARGGGRSWKTMPELCLLLTRKDDAALTGDLWIRYMHV